MFRLGRGLDEMTFALGQATHFVQDLNQPLHAGWGETRAEHNEVEAQMLYRWHALGPERAWQLYGIPEPVKEVGNGSLWRSAGRAHSCLIIMDAELDLLRAMSLN